MLRKQLDIARLNRDAYTAKIQYQRIRMQELEMMRSLVEDECEETQVLLTRTERQIGEIRAQLCRSRGMSAIYGPGIDTGPVLACLKNGTYQTA